nr:immunoglobulin light chain junction region [Macaca mulatta]
DYYCSSYTGGNTFLF